MRRFTLAIACALVLTSGAPASAVPPVPAPASVHISGTISPAGASGNYAPAAMNGGKTQGFIEVPAAWTMDAMPAGGLEPKQFIAFSDATSIITPPATLAKKTGTCKVTIGDFGATFVAASGQRFSSLTVMVTEPGCDSSKMLQEKLTEGLEATTTATWKPTGTKIPVRLSIAPKAP
jgi:hypothetical protein